MNFSAQRISNFNLYVVGKSVVVNFTITQGAPCNEYKVFYSTDSVNFTVIQDFVGACSDAFQDVSNSYTHVNPAINHYNYYKVQLDIGEVSAIKGIYVSSKGAPGLFLYPNPIDNNQDYLTVKALASPNARLSGSIYDSTGKNYSALEVVTYNSLATFSINGFQNGMYIIRLSDGAAFYYGKFIVMR